MTFADTLFTDTWDTAWANLDGEHPDGLPRTRSKMTHPYSYDPFVIWKDPNLTATNTVYSDRLHQWDYKKHNDLCEKHFGNQGQYWDRRAPKAIEAFLRDYNDNPTLELVRIVEYCNASNGYPCWRLDYTESK